MGDWLSMGGYGGFVWSAYGFTLAILGGLLWQSRRFTRKRASELAALRQRADRAPARRTRPLVAQPVGESQALARASGGFDPVGTASP